MRKLKLQPTLVAAVAILTLLSGFFLARNFSDGETAGANQAIISDESELPGSDSTPPPGDVDTSKPGWYTPYENAERAKPRYDQTIAGIRVGPNVDDPGVPNCGSGEARDETDFDFVNKGYLAILPGFLPDRAVLGRHVASVCRGVVVTHVAEYEVVADDDADAQTAGGTPWEDVEHGGKVTVFRSLASGPVYRTGNHAAERWREVAVAGRPAAVADPILPLGLGRSAIVLWEAENGVRTIITGTNRTTEELLRIAEALK